MGLFSGPQTGGLIRYYGLVGWWNATFTTDERRHIQTVFQPLGSSGEKLTHGNISYTSQSATAFLGNLAGWFSKDPDRHIAYRLLSKASETAGQGCSILDLHFLDQQLVQTCYRDRDQQAYLDAAISACEHQIAIAPQAAIAFRAEWGDDALPAHRGYEQLAIIPEKQGDYDAVVVLCEQAAGQGWAGDWQKRIDRVKKRQAKA